MTELLIDDSEEKYWKYNSLANKYLRNFYHVADKRSIISRGFALQVDGCPIATRSWHGKPYATDAVNLQCGYWPQPKKFPYFPVRCKSWPPQLGHIPFDNKSYFGAGLTLSTLIRRTTPATRISSMMTALWTLLLGFQSGLLL